MQDHAVVVDYLVRPSTIVFAPVFNVAVPFIDRHVREGRSLKTAIRTVEGGVSHGELAERVNRCGNALYEMGLSPGDRLLMVVKDCPEFFYLFWGAIKAGMVPVPVNTLLRAPDLQYMIEDSGCAAVAYSPEYGSEVAPAVASADRRPSVLATEGGDDALEARLVKSSPTLDVVPASAERDCFWLYSSGSTGRPKAAVHRHRDIVATCVHYAVNTLGVREDDVCFSAAKLFFAYGLGNSMTFPLWAGATALLSDQRPTPETTFDLMERFKPTLYFGVPTLYAAQLRELEQAPRNLSSLRLCVSAGEALPPDIFRRWKRLTNLTILDGIGSTELLHIFVSNRLDDCKPGSSGRLVPGYEAQILDENGGPVGHGEAGRLMVKGASAARCYWNNPEKTAQMMRGEWVNTGDTYMQDDEGYFVYCGRSDDMLKVGGIWCSPVEIESRLVEHPKVLEAAVVGRADDAGLVKPEAHVVLNEPADADETLAGELMTFCKDGLARYKYPRWIHFVDELPKTATGKIRRFQLRG